MVSSPLVDGTASLYSDGEIYDHSADNKARVAQVFTCLFVPRDCDTTLRRDRFDLREKLGSFNTEPFTDGLRQQIMPYRRAA